MKLTTKLNLALAFAFVLALLVGGAVAYLLAPASPVTSLVAFAVALTAAFAVLLLVLNLALRRIVLTPLARVKGLAEQVSDGNLRGPELKADGDDEIADMLNAMNRMRRAMIKLVQLLRKHAPSTRNAA